MKINLRYLIVVLLPLISLNTQANEIYKGKIVNHKEWTTEGATLTLKPTNHFLTERSMRSHRSMDAVSNYYGFTETNSVLTTTGEHVKVPAYQRFEVENTSATKQYYYVNFELCVELQPKYERCGYFYDMVELEPGGYYTSESQPELTIPGFSAAGVYKSHAESRIMRRGDDESTPYMHNFSQANAVIKVS